MKKCWMYLVLFISGLMSACTNTFSEEDVASEIMDQSSSQISALGDKYIEPPKSKYDINAYPMHKLVCDPFDPSPSPSPEHGIKASLWYRGAQAPRYYSVIDYMTRYTASEQKLFFNSINVPTRMFNSGFPIESGGVVKDDTGKNLIEFFAMKFEADIMLTNTDPEGFYELAILSDDGTILKIKEPDSQGVIPSSWETHINNDGDSSTRMKCSKRLIDFKYGKKVSMELNYYQGPKYHISNMLIWRKATEAGKDPECNKSGNSYFFDPNKNSAPLKWTNLSQRGWKPIDTQNFFLSQPENQILTPSQGQTNYNACASGGDLPVISEFQIIEQLTTDVTFSWKTKEPAISQLLVTNLDTGKKTVTLTDNVLRTTHEIKISNLQNNTNYRFQVIAISENLGRTTSEGIDLKTF